VHFVPDADNRRGAITCISVGSQDGGECKAYTASSVTTLGPRLYPRIYAYPRNNIVAWWPRWPVEHHSIDTLPDVRPL
jgi:hypothetical protein